MRVLHLRVLDPEAACGLAAVESLYMSSFPSSERKAASFVRLASGRADYEVLSLGCGRRADAFAIVYQPPEPFVLIEYLAVDPSERNRGVGTNLVERIAERHRGHVIVVEVEAETAEAGGQAVARKRFYRKLHFRQIEGLNYHMPQVADTAPPPMHMMIRGAGDTISKVCLSQWLIAVFTGVYGVRNASAAVEDMLRNCPERLAII